MYIIQITIELCFLINKAAYLACKLVLNNITFFRIGWIDRVFFLLPKMNYYLGPRPCNRYQKVYVGT